MSTMKASKRDIDVTSKTEEIFFDNGETLPAFFNVDSRDIKEGKKIGEGNWIVHEAEWLGRKVAVKKFGAKSTFGNVSLTSREVNRMLSLQHPNVLKLLGFYLTTQKEQVLECTMIMELMDCDLEDYIAKGPLSDDQVVYLFAEVARGMNHIHKSGCFHRDLKPKNVLVRKSVVTGFYVDVKIADFGSSELLGIGDINRTAGTMGYKAPEQFDFASSSKLFPSKVDVFGFGALCFKVLTGKVPYENRMNMREVIKTLDRATIFQQNLPKDVVEMIWKCLDVNPDLRPDFGNISGILDSALLTIREKMPRPLPSSSSACLHLEESMQKGFEGHDHLERILGIMGLSKKHVVHFIPSKELFVIELLGEGSFASVYKVEWKGILYAQKIFSEHIGFGSSPRIFHDRIESYFEILPKLSHENIVTFMGYSITSDNRISIIFEFLQMNLEHMIVMNQSLFERNPSRFIPRRLTILREIAEGMKYLHEYGVIHGDLNPTNVIVSTLDTGELLAKLIDFGNNPLVCTSRYAAPEILRTRRTRSMRTITIDEAKKSDVYSFGILCQHALGGASHKLFHGKHVERVLLGERPPIPIGTSPKIESLIKSCWNEDPQERPNFSEICESLSQVLYYDSCQGQTYVEQFVQRCWFL